MTVLYDSLVIGGQMGWGDESPQVPFDHAADLRERIAGLQQEVSDMNRDTSAAGHLIARLGELEGEARLLNENEGSSPETFRLGETLIKRCADIRQMLCGGNSN